MCSIQLFLNELHHLFPVTFASIFQHVALSLLKPYLNIKPVETSSYEPGFLESDHMWSSVLTLLSGLGFTQALCSS